MCNHRRAPLGCTLVAGPDVINMPLGDAYRSVSMTAVFARLFAVGCSLGV